MKYISLGRVTELFQRFWDSKEPQGESLSPNGKTRHSSEPSQKELTFQNSSKSTVTTHPGRHKKAKDNIKEMQASLASIKVTVHDSTIRKTLDKNGIHGRAANPE